MTIAAGFVADNGLVICADSEETVADYIKRSQVKIEIRPYVVSKDQPFAVFSGAGDGIFVDHLVEKLWKAMESKTTVDAMAEAAEDELLRIYQRFVPLFPSGVPAAEFLIGLWASPNDLELIKIEGAIVKRHVVGDFIGFGTLLSTYIANRFLYPKQSLPEAVAVAIYAVNEAKQHVRECGGETHVVTAMLDGSIKWHPQFEVEKETRFLAGVDKIVRRIAGMAMDRRTDWEYLRSKFDEEMEEIRKLREATDSK